MRRALLCLVLGLPTAASADAGTAAAQIKSMPSPDADPARALMINTLRWMAANIHWQGDVPNARGRDPHEWAGDRVIEEGSFNGCVEAAKAFKTLYDASSPPQRAVYVLGTRPGEDGGHAVIELTGGDGMPFIVDTVLFQRAAPSVTEQDFASPGGKTLQNGREDIHIDKQADGYVLTRWQFTHLFQPDRKLGPDVSLKDLAEVNRWLGENGSPLKTFADFEKAGVIKHEKDGGFLGPEGEKELIFEKTDGEPFSGNDDQRVKSGERAREDKVKFGR